MNYVPPHCVSVVLLVLWSSNSLWAQSDWNQFRGPNGDGTSSSTSLPTHWSETEHVKWKVDIDGKAWSSPVVWGQQIWLSNATPDGKELSAICIDRETGEVLFNEIVFKIAEPQFCIERNSYASSTPIIEAKRVYLHFGAHGTACLDTETFKTVWVRQDLECDHFRGPASSPIIWQDLLILTFDGADVQYLAALDKHTGKTVWRTSREFNYGTDNGDAMKAYSTPSVATVADHLELISPSAGSAAAYDPATGKELWRVSSGGMNAGCRPVIHDDVAYLGTADGGFKFFAVKLGGSGDVTDSHVVWKEPKGAPRYSSALVVDNRVYVGNEKGILTCLDAESGEAIWQERVGGLFMPSPIYADGKIYFFAEEGTTYVLEPGQEFKLLATNQIQGEIMASPAIADGALLIRTKSALYCIE